MTDSSPAERDSKPEAARSAARPERPLNVPNLITLSRLVLAFVLFGMISAGSSWRVSAAVFVVAAATDWIDGYIARKYGLVTTLGRIMDPFVDKIIVCGAFVFLLEHSRESGVNAWMVIAVVGREMFVTGLRSFLEQAGKDFSAVWSGKFKMALQCVAVTASLLSMDQAVKSPTFDQTRDALLWITVAVTIYSGLVYALRGYEMLRPSKTSRVAPERGSDGRERG